MQRENRAQSLGLEGFEQVAIQRTNGQTGRLIDHTLRPKHVLLPTKLVGTLLWHNSRGFRTKKMPCGARIGELRKNPKRNN